MVLIAVDIARGRILITFSKLFLPYILSEEIDDLKKIPKANIELFELFGFSAIDCIVSYVLVFFLHKWLAFRLLRAKNQILNCYRNLSFNSLPMALIFRF